MHYEPVVRPFNRCAVAVGASATNLNMMRVELINRIFPDIIDSYLNILP